MYISANYDLEAKHIRTQYVYKNETKFFGYFNDETSVVLLMIVFPIATKFKQLRAVV